MSELPAAGRTGPDGAVADPENARRERAPPTRRLPAGRRALRIGLLNLLPEAALRSGERLVAPLRACGVPLQLHRLAPSRSAAAGYRTGLPEQPLDGLLVTGAEPAAADLADEPFWPELAAAIDWAARNTRSTVFSCLAAHAAVRHLDGVPRRRLARKCFGLFPVEAAAPGGYGGAVCHSRWHDLDERELASAGYTVLSRMPGAVDSFAKRVEGSRFLFLQGHPEYGSDALGREYRRDVGRFLAAPDGRYPDLPVGYYDPVGEAALLAFREAALAGRAHLPEMPSPLPAGAGAAAAGASPAEAGAAVLGGWLRRLAAEERR